MPIDKAQPTGQPQLSFTCSNVKLEGKNKECKNVLS